MKNFIIPNFFGKKYMIFVLVACATFFVAQTMNKTTAQTDQIFQIIAADEHNAQPINMNKATAQLSLTLKNMIDDLGITDEPIPVHNVSHVMLQRVVEYLYLIHNNNNDLLTSKISDLGPEGLFDVLQAANYLDIDALRSRAAQRWGALCDDNFDDFKKNQTYRLNKIFTLSKQLPLELNQLCAQRIPSTTTIQILSKNFLLTNRKSLSGHTNGVKSVCFSPDGKTLASGSGDETIKLWNVADYSLITTLSDHSDIVTSVCFSPDGKTLASGSFDASIKIWNVTDGSCIQTLYGHSDIVTSVCFSPDGTTLASGSLDDTIKLWNVTDGSLITTLSGHTKSVTSVCFSPDGKTLASGSDDNTIKLWNVADGSLITTLSGHTNGVTSICFSPDGKALASGSSDKSIKLWNVADGSLVTTLSGHTNDVTSICFSPDGATLASGSSGWTLFKFWSAAITIRLWNVADGSLITALSGHTDYVNSVCFSPDGTTLASGSSDKTIKLWWNMSSLRSFLDSFSTLTIEQVLFLRLVKEAADDKKTIDLSLQEHAHLAEIYVGLPEEIQKLVRAYLAGVEV